MKKRVERSHNAFFTRCGVKDLAGLDNLFGSAVNYDKTKLERDELSQKFMSRFNVVEFPSFEIDELKIIAKGIAEKKINDY